jgi:hypothetical protein
VRPNFLRALHLLLDSRRRLSAPRVFFSVLSISHTLQRTTTEVQSLTQYTTSVPQPPPPRFSCPGQVFFAYRRPSQVSQYPLTNNTALLNLASEAPRPGLGRSSTSYFHQKIAALTPPPRKPTFADIVEEGVEPSPWNKDHPNCLRNKYNDTPWHEGYRTYAYEKRKRQEQRRVNRQLDVDGPRSLEPSPIGSRANSFFPPSRANTNSSGNSDRSTPSLNSSHQSTKSANSSRVPSFLRVLTQLEDDRKYQGLEARKDEQLRKSDSGTDRQSDTSSYGGQGQRGLFGKHKSKGVV